jgi:hypothetical protein
MNSHSNWTDIEIQTGNLKSHFKVTIVTRYTEHKRIGLGQSSFRMNLQDVSFDFNIVEFFYTIPRSRQHLMCKLLP